MANTTTGAAAAAEPTAVLPATSNFTVTFIGPPPPFPAPPRSVDLSPLKFILAVIAVISIPALAYAFFFAVPCSPGRRSSSSSHRRGGSSDDLPPESAPPPQPRAAAADGVKFQKEAHSKEMGNECPVCLSVFADGEAVQQLSACKHAFHSSCIDLWLSDNSNCPICRAVVPGKRPAVNGNVNGNRTNGTAGGNRRVSASHGNDDWHQGLPDASSLV